MRFCHVEHIPNINPTLYYCCDSCTVILTVHASAEKLKYIEPTAALHIQKVG